MQVKTYDVVYDDSIRCRTTDLRCRMNIRHRLNTMSYVLRHRRCTTYMTYDIVCNIGIIRCRTSDVRHRTSARIQMECFEGLAARKSKERPHSGVRPCKFSMMRKCFLFQPGHGTTNFSEKQRLDHYQMPHVSN